MYIAQIKEIDMAIVAGTVVFILFAGFITVYIMIYWKRKMKYLQEVEKMKLDFGRELLKSQLEIQEQTFTIISQEIHDNVGQILSLAKVQVNIIDQSETKDRYLFSELKENISKAMTDLRDIARSLNSDYIQTVELKDLIAEEMARINRTGIISATMKEGGSPQKLPYQNKLIVFRIIQESLHNIIKHAEATAVTVVVNYSGDTIEISVQDNGKGFDVEGAKQAGGLGLQNISSRTTLIGGKALIKSSPGQGAIISLTIPYA